MEKDKNIGRVLEDKYELVRVLGKGGMGAVYEAQHLLIGRRLAVKLLHAEYASDHATVERFKREAQTAASIGHEHIVEITDMGVTDTGELFIVMEYLEGTDLSALLQKEERLSFKRACHIMIQILSALESAHSKGIVHRDLKPANIFITQHGGVDDYVKLVDFGISKVREGGEDTKHNLTRTGELLGTPLFMSPEQAKGEVNISAQSDVFSCGVILYRMVTGALPFEENAITLLLIKIIQEEPISPSHLRAETPPELAAAIIQAMAKLPSERFSNASAFRRAITRFSPETPVLAGLKHTRVSTQRPSLPPHLTDSGPRETPATALDQAVDRTPFGMVSTIHLKEKHRRWMAIAAILGVVLAVVGVSVFFMTSGPTGGDPSASENIVPVTSAQPITSSTLSAAANTPLPAAAPPPTQTTSTVPKPKEIASSSSLIGFNVAVSPPNAVVLVDGNRLGQGSVDVQMAADGKEHVVKVHALGHVPFEEKVVFDKQINLAINLEPSTTRTRVKSKGATSQSKGQKTKANSQGATSSSKSPRPVIEVVQPAEKPAEEKPKDNPADDMVQRPIDLDAPW